MYTCIFVVENLWDKQWKVSLKQFYKLNFDNQSLSKSPIDSHTKKTDLFSHFIERVTS